MAPAWQRRYRFGLIGAIGFAVDWALFNLLIWFGLQPLSARLVAFAAAATTTWLGNRRLTFADRNSGSALPQAGQYLLMVLLSLLPNLAVFTALSVLAETHWWGMQLALAGGVLAGMVSNYLLSERWVFAKVN